MTELKHRNELIQSCKKLKLSSRLADRAYNVEGEDHIEFLYNLLEGEIQYREKNKAENLVKAANFPRRDTFELFRSDEVEFPSGCSLEDLKNLDFYSKGNNVIMYGGTGTGKTMLSICIGMAACRHKIPVSFYRTANLVNKFSESKRNGKLDSLTKKLNKSSILILDEFGYVPYDRIGIDILYDYLSEIQDNPKKVVILNTNLEFSKWVNVLYSEQMTAALVGRLTHHCSLILFPGQNNRLKESSISNLYRSIAEKSREG